MDPSSVYIADRRDGATERILVARGESYSRSEVKIQRRGEYQSAF